MAQNKIGNTNNVTNGIIQFGADLAYLERRESSTPRAVDLFALTFAHRQPILLVPSFRITF